MGDQQGIEADMEEQALEGMLLFITSVTIATSVYITIKYSVPDSVKTKVIKIGLWRRLGASAPMVAQCY